MMAKTEGDLCNFDVFLGWEWCFSGTEFLTYGLSADFLLSHRNLDKLTVEQYCALVREHGGYNAQAHPFRRGYWIKNPFPVKPELMDGIEVYNACMPDEVNKKARDFAKRHNLPIQAGSDSHDKDISFASGIKLAKRAESIFDIIEAIKAKNVELVMPKRW